LVDPIQKELQQRLQNGGRCQKLTSAQIKQATNNFQRTLGIGGFGGVYYGKLVNGQEVVVKTLSTTSHQTKQEFFNEVRSLYNCKKIMKGKKNPMCETWIQMCKRTNSYMFSSIGGENFLFCFVAD
jgi:hypothetical protein